MKSLFPVGLAVAFFSSDQLWAQDLIGAEKVIEKVTSQIGRKTSEPDTTQALQADLKNYRDERFALTPEIAAQQWLALSYRLSQLGHMRLRSGGAAKDYVSFQDLVSVLPPSASWPYLEKGLSSRKVDTISDEIFLLAQRWFVHTLTGNLGARDNDYRILIEKLSPEPESSPMVSSVLSDLTQQMLLASDNPVLISQLLESLLRMMMKASAQQTEQSDMAQFRVPSLVATLGEKDAEAFLKKVLTTYPGPIIITDNRTSDLARRIASENIAQLAGAQWSLTRSYEPSDLYSQMVKRFGPQPKNHEYQEAQSFELARLFLANKWEEALQMQESPRFNYTFVPLPYDFLTYAKKSGAIGRLAKPLEACLEKKPELPYWREYFAAANSEGDSDRAISLMKQTLATGSLPQDAAASLRQTLASALFASSQVEAGVNDLLKLASADSAKNSGGVPSSGKIGLDIARIGFLMNRPEWTKEGLTLANRELDFLKKQSGDPRSPALSFANLQATTLIQIGQPGKAEEVLTNILGWQEQHNAAQPPSYATDVVNSTLAALVGIYSDAGRAGDVLAILNRAPWWIATDLSQIMDQSVPRADLQKDYLADAAARALHAVGQNDAALRIIEAQLAKSPGDDRAYELLLQVAGKQALPILDRLATQHRFEERPLIWKAQILLTEGKLQEAEAAIRTAISMDPSDGEEGPGDRMRAYTLLAEIREAQGDAKEAEFFRNVVKAIRLSEEADQLYKVGVIGPALAMYQSSLAIFSDAYCIQSRLALRLNEQGRWKEAEEHYRKAYELMPGSFGRIESHCFGCEGAFQGEKPQGVADRVFTKLAQEKPDSPQVHYLLGYLRESQGRPEEALRAYQRATTLDPDYLNAWKRMATLGTSILLTTDERNAISLNLARLNPGFKSSSFILAGTTDLGAVWTILLEADKRYAPTPPDLYPLTASARAIEKVKADSARRHYYTSLLRYIERDRTRELPPTANLTKSSFVEATSRLFDVATSLRLR